MFRFMATFALVLLGLFVLELLEPVQAAVIQPFTETLARVSVALMAPFDETVTNTGRVLRDARSGFAVSVESGCNGVEASIVLIAGVLAFPATWRNRVAAIGSSGLSWCISFR